MDRLSALLGHFSVRAGLFHSGLYCGAHWIDDPQAGFLHVLHQGRLTVAFADGSIQSFTEPTLLFFPRPAAHRFIAAVEDGVELVCATLRFEGGADNPIAQAFPAYVAVGLHALDGLRSVLDGLFREAFTERCGRAAALERWFELLLIDLLRYFMNENRLPVGMLAGLADLRLARVLNQIHAQPAYGWTLDALAVEAGMSRARFAAHFRTVVGQTVGDYLLQWRVMLAQKALRMGRPMKLIAAEVGYETPSALARAFRRRTAMSPGEWLAHQSLSHS